MKIKPLNVFKISMLYMIMFSSVACKKNDSEKPYVTTKEELKNNAQFNDTIIKGAGNLLIQERRTPNNDAEHFATLAYERDSIFFTGTTDSNGLAKNLTGITIQTDNDQFFITEYLDNATVSISYIVNKEVKSNIVLRTSSYGGQIVEYAVLDYDWANNAHNVLASVLYEGDNMLANSTLKKSQLLASNGPVAEGSPILNECKNPPPANTDEMNKKLQKDMQFIACHGTHPVNQPFVWLQNKLSDLGDKIDQNELAETIKNNETLSNIFNNISGALDKLKMNTIKVSSQLGDTLLNLLSKYGTLGKPLVLLNLNRESSTLDFYELKHKYIVAAFNTIDFITRDPLKGHRVAVKFELISNDQVVYSKVQYTSENDGTVQFSISPEEIAGVVKGKDTKLTANYGLFDNITNETVSIPVNIEWVRPTIEKHRGDGQQDYFGIKLSEPLVVLVSDQFGNPLADWLVNWEVGTGNGFLTYETKTSPIGLAKADWTLGNDEATQTVHVQVLDRKEEVITSTIFTANATIFELKGKWIMEHYTLYTESPLLIQTDYVDFFGGKEDIGYTYRTVYHSGNPPHPPQDYLFELQEFKYKQSFNPVNNTLSISVMHNRVGGSFEWRFKYDKSSPNILHSTPSHNNDNYSQRKLIKQ